VTAQSTQSPPSTQSLTTPSSQSASPVPKHLGERTLLRFALCAGRDIGTFARHCEPGSYLLEVAANMDLALVVTIVAAIDQMFSD
jgi:hypothetical protein